MNDAWDHISPALKPPEGQRCDEIFRPRRTWERKVIPTWAAGAVSDVITPSRPIVAISLGPLDESGGVTIQGCADFPDGAALGVGAPLVGLIGSTFQVASFNSTGVAAALQHKLDLILWYELPPSFPRRAPRYWAGTLTGIASEYFPTFGRRRVRAVMFPPSAASTLYISGGIIGPAGALQDVQVAGGAAQTLGPCHEFSSALAPVAGAAGTSSSDFTPDYVALGQTTAVVTTRYQVAAFDE